MPGHKYVISDIHNNYYRFKNLLKKIQFTEKDTLYIDGDIFDRGENPLELYRYIRGQDNIVPIMGNHDRWLADYIRDCQDNQSAGLYPYNTFRILQEYLDEVGLQEVQEWIETFPLYEITEAGGRTYMLAHARTVSPTASVSEAFFYFSSVDFQYLQRGIPEMVSVIGHVPVDQIRYWVGDDPEKKNTIWVNRMGNVFCIDCGCGFTEEKVRLGCLCLDNLSMFYA